MGLNAGLVLLHDLQVEWVLFWGRFQAACLHVDFMQVEHRLFLARFELYPRGLQAG